MPENCEKCPVSIRLDGLEKEFNRYREDSKQIHEGFDGRLREVEQDNSAVKTKLDGMDTKLDKLVAWREEQDDKPNKFLDKLKENAAWLFLAAFLGAAIVKIWGFSA